MKHSRAAAILAGSFAAMGAATPAFAAEQAAMPPMSLNNGVAEVVSAGVSQLEETAKPGAALGKVTDTVTDLNSVKGNAPEQVLKTAAATTPMLGGISLGG
ncbi:hypothetical protein ACF08N_07990 [Streptomyces sp. NPDC015127]|uniref:hypothetical protein n=1 Tax=Streptomyces sp. NPDC015127 TaxID=3364939 RepID=UPI0037021C3A